MDQYDMEQPTQQPPQIQQPSQIQRDMMQSNLSPKRIISRSFFALFMLAVTVNVVQVAVELLVMWLRPELAETGWYIWALTIVSLVVIGFPVYYLIIRKVPDSPRGEGTRISPIYFIGFFLVCTAAMYITNFATQIIVFFISQAKGDELKNYVMDAITGGDFIITLIYTSVVAPIYEEIVFRKILLNKLRRFGDVPAILMTGFAFGIFHFNLLQFFYAAVLGFLFAYITIRTNKIIYAIILHMMINFIATAITPLVLEANMVAILIIFNWVLAAIFLGGLILLLNIKKIRLEKTAPLMKASGYFLNPGVILFLGIGLVLITIATLM